MALLTRVSTFHHRQVVGADGQAFLVHKYCNPRVCLHLADAAVEVGPLHQAVDLHLLTHQKFFATKNFHPPSCTMCDD